VKRKIPGFSWTINMIGGRRMRRKLEPEMKRKKSNFLLDLNYDVTIID
jgi:hypothetical protein